VDNQTPGAIDDATVDDIDLDEDNPRLRFYHHGEILSQARLTQILFRRFSLEELGQSFLVNGYFSEEPLVCVREDGRLVVVEGNRRLAALRLLIDGPEQWGVRSRRFAELHEDYLAMSSSERNELRIPFVEVVDDRDDIVAYVGFRHVTGIKPWPALEKAGYIAKLVDDDAMDPRQIAKMIGSKPVYVARHYQAYRLLVQARDSGEDVEPIQRQFGVLMRSLQTDGVKDFIGLTSVSADGPLEEKPLPAKRMKYFMEFSAWVFGTAEEPPVMTDSRLLTRFGRILRSKRALAYLREYPSPTFEKAFMLSGGEKEDAQEAMRVAELALRDCVASARGLKKDKEFRGTLTNACDYMSQILTHYPVLFEEYFAGVE